MSGIDGWVTGSGFTRRLSLCWSWGYWPEDSLGNRYDANKWGIRFKFIVVFQ